MNAYLTLTPDPVIVAGMRLELDFIAQNPGGDSKKKKKKKGDKEDDPPTNPVVAP